MRTGLWTPKAALWPLHSRASLHPKVSHAGTCIWGLRGESPGSSGGVFWDNNPKNYTALMGPLDDITRNRAASLRRQRLRGEGRGRPPAPAAAIPSPCHVLDFPEQSSHLSASFLKARPIKQKLRLVITRSDLHVGS